MALAAVITCQPPRGDRPCNPRRRRRRSRHEHRARTHADCRSREATALARRSAVQVETSASGQPRSRRARPTGPPESRQSPRPGRTRRRAESDHCIAARPGHSLEIGEDRDATRPGQETRFLVPAGRAHGPSQSSATCPGCRPRPGRLSGRPIRNAAELTGRRFETRPGLEPDHLLHFSVRCAGHQPIQ